MIYAGTSGFSYKEWKGILYPEDLPQKEYLHYYSRQFNSAEINNTFYRIPSEKTTAQWAGVVPSGFRFALKLNQRITHRKRLMECDEEMGWFLEGANPLWSQLGCILVQLPPWFKQDLQVLGGFLGRFADKAPLALEFRHESWFDSATLDLLRDHKASLVVAESDKLEAVREVTAPFIYLRLRKPEYTREDIEGWAGWIREQKRDVYAYFKHGTAAPTLVRQLNEAIRSDHGGSSYTGELK